MKDYLVLSHEGNVKILDIPNNTTKSDVVEIARRVICETNKPVAGLNNVETYKNYEIDELEERFFDRKFPKDFFTVVYYGDYK